VQLCHLARARPIVVRYRRHTAAPISTGCGPTGLDLKNFISPVRSSAAAESMGHGRAGILHQESPSRLTVLHRPQEWIEGFIPELLGIDSPQAATASDGRDTLTDAKLALAHTTSSSAPCSRKSSTGCWRARTGRSGRRVSFRFCPIASGSTSPVGPRGHFSHSDGLRRERAIGRQLIDQLNCIKTRF